MIVFYLAWLIVQRVYAPAKPLSVTPEPTSSTTPPSQTTPLLRRSRDLTWHRYHDFVDTKTVDLYRDEYVEEEHDVAEDLERKERLSGKARWLWRAYYIIA